MRRARVALLLAVPLAVLIGVMGEGAGAQRRVERAQPISTTSHRVELPGRVLAFQASVARVPVLDAKGRTDAEAGLIAFVRDGGERSRRPVTFVVSGGPGSGGAYLNIGGFGPWRIDFAGSISTPRALAPNAETWLDFTDLVFIDPPGTGFARITRDTAEVRARMWSVNGDIDALAGVIARWLTANDRLRSPKLFLGQSYGGFRGPGLAGVLRRSHGVALNGLVLLSPILDYGWRNHARISPLSFASLLPSFAAARLEREGRFTPEALRDVEAYAAGEFMTDFMRGLGDAAAVDRMVERVGAITGLPPEIVRRARGRNDEQTFAREIAHAEGRVTSSYDASVSSADPDPTLPRPEFADPFLSAAHAPFTAAMAELFRSKLGMSLREPYQVSSETVFDGWDWGSEGGLPEAVSALRRALALDRGLHVLVAHGYTDLQTPYFESKLILDQLPDLGTPERIRRRTYAGGHMFYSRSEARAAFRADGEAFIRAIVGE
jgi:carboxypeptidase C (cathepsin A)